MKSSTINLDLTNVKPESDSPFSKVPEGIYTVVVAHSQFKEGKKSGASGLQIGYMIESGPHSGKMIQDYVNIQNENEQAVEIGLGRLRRICEAQNRKSLKLAKDTDLINGSKFQVEVVMKKDMIDGKEAESNRVKKIMNLEDAKDTTTQAKQEKVKETPKAEPQEEKMPWEE